MKAVPPRLTDLGARFGRGFYQRLPAFVLDQLPPAEMQALGELCLRDPILDAEVSKLREAFASLALGLPLVPPRPAIKARLFATLETSGRFVTFLPKLAALLDLPGEKVRAVLALIDDPGAWQGGLPGIEAIHFAAGPALGSADAGFLRFQPGAVFPHHRHLGGVETTFVLEGTLVDGGQNLGPGSIVQHPPGSAHHCGASSAAERPLLTMVIHQGIEPIVD